MVVFESFGNQEILSSSLEAKTDRSEHFFSKERFPERLQFLKHYRIVAYSIFFRRKTYNKLPTTVYTILKLPVPPANLLLALIRNCTGISVLQPTNSKILIAWEPSLGTGI